MSGMSVDLGRVRKQLTDLHARLLAEHKRHRETEDESEEVGELADVDFNHPADLASELFDRMREMALSADVTVLIQQVDDALARLDAGTYGKCIRCGKQISAARLHELPFAAYDIDCQRIVEATE